MTRLFAYLTYLIPLGALVLLINIIYGIIVYKETLTLSIIMIVTWASIYFLFVSRFRRVYYERSLIYVYDLFSKKSVVLTQENIISIRLFAYNLPLIYVIFYYNGKGNKRYLIFLRNMLCKDFNKIVNEFYIS